MIRILAAIACCWTAAAQASNIQLTFDVYLDDKPVGEHRVIVDDVAGAKRVSVEAEFDVKILGLTAYRYRHTADEVWRDGCIVELRTRTDDNGNRLGVEAGPVNDGLQVRTGNDRETIGGCARTFAYWDPALLESPRLINTQTGEHESTSLAKLGNNPFTFKGRTYGSRHYRLSVADKADIDLWYGPDNRWAALQTRLSGGKLLRYVRKES